MTQTFSFSTIGTVHACYKEKFGVPRQPGLVNVVSSIEIHSPYNSADAFRELFGFSHIWITFVFHQTLDQSWRPTVRPPRLGGNERVGVFASRSMFRPNPIGLSLVEFKQLRQQDGKLFIDVVGADLIDGTPVLDIKPYLPYAESIPDARAGYASDAPLARLQVVFTSEARVQLQQLQKTRSELEQTIVAILQLDPRPAYQDAATKQKTEYGIKLFDLDIKFRIRDDVAEVYGLLKL